jgi:hypothetical protein
MADSQMFASACREGTRRSLIPAFSSRFAMLYAAHDKLRSYHIAAGSLSGCRVEKPIPRPR